MDTSSTAAAVQINTSPTVSAATSATMNEDGTLTITKAMLLANASDFEGDALSASNLKVSQGSVTDNGDGTWSYTPDANWNGSLDISYDVSDGTATTSTTMGVTVSAVNDGPTVSAATSATMNEDGTLTISNAMLLANASDVEGDTLSASNLSVSQGSVTDNGDGTWSYTPDANWNGSLDISYDVSDGTATTSTTMGVTVSAVNDGPTVSAATSATMNEDGTLTITNAMLVANASDVEGDTLSASNLSVAQGSVTDNGDGTWSYTPDANWNGSLDISYDVSDGTATTSTTMGVTVSAVNDGPTVSAATSATMNEDGTLTISNAMLVANASDVEGDTLSASNLSVSQGSVTDNGDGTWSYTPDANWNGSLDISYDVSDGTATTSTTMGVTVSAVNDGPTVSAATSATMNEDGTLTISNAMLLANASDVEGDTLSASNLSVSQGSVTDNGDGTWSYTPDANWNGSLDISYDVSDGTATTSTTMGVTVSAVNDGPTVSAATSATMNEDGTLTITNAMLVANASDVDGDTLSATNLSVAQGSVTDNGDGTWSYTPDADWSGSLNISYDVSDGTATISTTMGVTVSAVADAPTVTATSSMTGRDANAGTVFDLNLVAALSDTDGSESLSSFTISNVPSGATLSAGTDNGDGTWTVTSSQASGLTMTADSSVTSDFTLSVSATSTDAGVDTATTSVNLNVSMDIGDTYSGGSGNDDYEGTDSNDTIYGNAGDDDELKGEDGADFIDGGAGDDVVKGGKGNDYLVGGSGKDELKGEDGIDKLYGGAGDDELDGGRGNDYLDGGAGEDELKGEDGIDTLYGGAGDDELDGGRGNDYLDGGAGEDELKGADGDDVLIFDVNDSEIDGGLDLDTLIFEAADMDINFDDFDDIVSNIEEIDITGAGDNTLTIDYNNIVNITDSDKTLTINGNAGDSVQLEGSWTETGQFTSGGDSYTTYAQNDATVVINDDITLT